VENIQTQRNVHLTRNAFGSYFEVVARKQTWLNLAYLSAKSAFWLIDLISIAVSWSLVFGLLAIPLWVLTWLPFDLGLCEAHQCCDGNGVPFPLQR
jgi:hypothetical protein